MSAQRRVRAGGIPFCLTLAGATVTTTSAQAAPASSVTAARVAFFGADNVSASGQVRSDRVIVSWFGVASMAMAIDGRVILLDT